jgi:hypothetical protein
MVVEVREDGLMVRYDRLRMFRAPNVTNVELAFVQTPAGAPTAGGGPRLPGLALLHTRMWLHPAPPVPGTEGDMGGSGPAETRIT